MYQERCFMICNMDCLNCPYPDCINDGLSIADIKRQDKEDKEITKETLLAKTSREVTYQKYNKSPKGKEANRRYKQSGKAKSARDRYYRENKEKILARQKERYNRLKESVPPTSRT